MTINAAITLEEEKLLLYAVRSYTSCLCVLLHNIEENTEENIAPTFISYLSKQSEKFPEDKKTIQAIINQRKNTISSFQQDFDALKKQLQKKEASNQAIIALANERSVLDKWI